MLVVNKLLDRIVPPTCVTCLLYPDLNLTKQVDSHQQGLVTPELLSVKRTAYKNQHARFRYGSCKSVFPS